MPGEEAFGASTVQTGQLTSRGPARSCHESQKALLRARRPLPLFPRDRYMSLAVAISDAFLNLFHKLYSNVTRARTSIVERHSNYYS